MAKAARTRTTADARPLDTAAAFAGVKKKKLKKSLIVVVAPAGKQFLNKLITSVEGKLSDNTLMSFDVSKAELSGDKTRLYLSIKGTKNRLKKAGRKLRTDITPDPGTLAITLTNPPVNTEPVVVVPVEFVDDLDP